MSIVAKKSETITSRKVELLNADEKHTVAGLVEKFNELATLVNELVDRPSRDRGPKSTRDMSREDAWRVRFGDLKDKSAKDAAKILGLSYGQVYSARGEYTFKDLQADEYAIEEDEPKADKAEESSS